MTPSDKLTAADLDEALGRPLADLDPTEAREAAKRLRRIVDALPAEDGGPDAGTARLLAEAVELLDPCALT